jgi:hypothetical protein
MWVVLARRLGMAFAALTVLSSSGFKKYIQKHLHTGDNQFQFITYTSQMNDNQHDAGSCRLTSESSSHLRRIYNLFSSTAHGNSCKILFCEPEVCRSQWPRRLRHELSSPAQTLGSWVRILLDHGCLYAFILSVLSCLLIAALRRADPPSKDSYRLCKRLRNWKSGQGPTKGCRAIDR